MDIKNLQTFIQVAELNSFTKAADVLGYSQSTVSSQIKQLEQELNCQLFERIYHTIALTDKGREVLNYAHQMSKMTQELERTIQDTKTVKGSVHIALSDSLCYVMLNEQFIEFTKNYPCVALKMTPAGTQDMFRMLNHNEVDLIMTLDSHIYDTNYVIVKEEKISVRFVVSSQHTLATKKTITIQELISYPFILTEKGMSYRRIFDEKLAEQSLEVQPILELGSTHLIRQLLEEGIGVSLLPDFVTKEAVDEGKLVYLDVEGFDIVVWKQLIYHKDKWVSPQMEAIISYL